ncbi:unnamed protein product [Paramecium pentaurelia]|uniref:Uncharacterized protein n=1 Tax=Paramecium pentaurelia TaxID=43138 RepID=A0A8S1V8P4_9CILI|nr:unnamed protein product [Paramecium pentaurelia]
MASIEQNNQKLHLWKIIINGQLLKQLSLNLFENFPYKIEKLPDQFDFQVPLRTFDQSQQFLQKFKNFLQEIKSSKHKVTWKIKHSPQYSPNTYKNTFLTNYFFNIQNTTYKSKFLSTYRLQIFPSTFNI